MKAVRIDQSDVKLFHNSDPYQLISGLRRRLLPKLKRLRDAAVSVTKQRLAIDPEGLAYVKRPANRYNAKEVVIFNEAYVGVSLPRSKKPLGVKDPEGKPRYYPPTYLYFVLYPDGRLQVELYWYRYKLQASFRRDLQALVESQGSWLLEMLGQRGIRSLNSAGKSLEATLDSVHCRWAGKPLSVPIEEGDVAWNEAIEDFVLLFPLARAAWRMAVGEVPSLRADCLALRKGPSLDAQSAKDLLGSALPGEVDAAEGYLEGSVHRVLVNAYERNPAARQRCVEHYGANCCICGFNFGTVYGGVAEGFIHVHHLRPLSEIGAEYVIDPVRDLRPVCPNCHAVLHRRDPAYSIEEVKAFLAQK
jgi:hypothetical protein